jgi:hypothetical protein
MPFIGVSPVTNFETTTAVQRFNGDGSDTTFTLTTAVSSVQDVLVSVDGVVQDTAAYTIPELHQPQRTKVTLRQVVCLEPMHKT